MRALWFRARGLFYCGRQEDNDKEATAGIQANQRTSTATQNLEAEKIRSRLWPPCNVQRSARQQCDDLQRKGTAYHLLSMRVLRQHSIQGGYMWDEYIDDDGCEGFEGENDADDFLDESVDEEGDCDEYQDFEETDGEDARVSESAEEELSRMDLTDALILGTMIAGNAYEEARLHRLISKSRK